MSAWFWLLMEKVKGGGGWRENKKAKIVLWVTEFPCGTQVQLHLEYDYSSANF